MMGMMHRQVSYVKGGSMTDDALKNTKPKRKDKGKSRLDTAGDRFWRGRQPDELTVTEVAHLWGLGRTWTWHLIVEANVIPYRKDRWRIYVRRKDAEAYTFVPKRGRPG
jgi:hypothetical protein